MNHKLILQKLLNFIVALMLVVYFGVMTASSAHASVAATRYVATTGSDVGDCASAVSPCRTIQHAVNQSSSGDKILVAQGIYTYSAQVDTCTPLNNIKPPSVICFVDKSLTILGGYSTTNWSTANPSVNLTVIDGQNTYRGVAAIGYLTTTASLDMQGFTIQNGRALGPTSYDTSGIGGGMLVQHAAVILKDMVFNNNQAIGQNTVSGAGGQADGAGLRIESAPPGTSSLLQRVTFDNNQSYGGVGPDRGGIAFGALFIYGTTVTVEDAIFTNNLAQAGSSTGNGTSGGLNADALGGAISIELCNTITLRRITITGNQIRGGNANLYAGGAYGAAILIEDTASFTISDSSIVNNTAIAGNAQTGGNAGGGAIHAADNGLVTFERVEIMSNSAIGGNSISGGNAGPGAGGGMYIFATHSGTFHATFKNVMIAENLANQGSGVTSSGNGGGGGVVVHGMNADFIQTTIARNHLGSTMVLGQGLVVQPWGSLPAEVNLNYSIVADHSGGGTLATAIAVQQGSALTFNHGLFAGNTKNTNADGSPVPVGTINGLSTMLSASSAGFVSPGSPNNNYHLRLDSPAKDQATSSAIVNDIDGQSRPYNGVSDLGADEYWLFPLFAIPGDGIMQLNWTTGASMLAGGVNKYEILVTCPAGANPPDQGGCGQPINAGTATTFTLTGLSNFKQYTIVVNARDSSRTLIATSTTVTAFPTNLLLYLPLVVR